VLRLCRLVSLVLLIAPVGVAAAEKVEILRDEFGVPHVYARTAAGAAFGSGYAQAADRAEQVRQNLRSANRGGGPRATLSARVQAIVEAYCAGINAYFDEQHRTADKVNASMVEAFSRSAYGLIPGSNDILIAPSRSSEKAVIAILAPQAEWNGAARLYEIEVRAAADGLAFGGAAPVGVPFPLMGHSDSIAIAASGAGPAGERVLDQVWALVTARGLDDAKRALAQGQLPAQRLLIGTAGGDIYDSRSGAANPAEGVLLAGGGAGQAAAMTRELLSRSANFSLESAESLALATDVYKAETWQLRIARTAPQSAFARMLTGWSRRADATSRPALAFYLFKMALGDDAGALEPPDRLSDDRLRSALKKAQDRLETEFAVDATWGSLFRVAREGGRRSWPVGGGAVAEAGMVTPRAIAFEKRGTLMIGRAGQAALQVVVLSRPARSRALVPLGESDDPASPHFDDQARELFSAARGRASYFGERKELERHAKERKELVFK
jgi:acyl-homoserine lactone acylase PvdQ